MYVCVCVCVAPARVMGEFLLRARGCETCVVVCVPCKGQGLGCRDYGLGFRVYVHGAALCVCRCVLARKHTSMCACVCCT